jgi:hypothetical protein
MVWPFFWYETYYLYEGSIASMEESNEADFMPNVNQFALNVISSNQEFDRLSAEGFDFRLWHPVYRRRLDAGAIAFSVFVGQELAHMAWAATTQRAMDSLDGPPFKVDFEAAEAASGGVWTHPKYRRLGFHAYTRLKLLQFLKGNGIAINRSVSSKQNIAAILTVDKFPLGLKIREARYLRILWWKSWKEKPLDESTKLLKRD